MQPGVVCVVGGVTYSLGEALMTHQLRAVMTGVVRRVEALHGMLQEPSFMHMCLNHTLHNLRQAPCSYIHCGLLQSTVLAKALSRQALTQLTSVHVSTGRAVLWDHKAAAQQQGGTQAQQLIITRLLRRVQ